MGEASSWGDRNVTRQGVYRQRGWLPRELRWSCTFHWSWRGLHTTQFWKSLCSLLLCYPLPSRANSVPLFLSPFCLSVPVPADPITPPWQGRDARLGYLSVSFATWHFSMLTRCICICLLTCWLAPRGKGEREISRRRYYNIGHINRWC